MPIGQLTQLVFECADSEQLAEFWRRLLDLDPPTGDPDWLTLQWPPVGRFSFHPVEDYRAPEWPGKCGEQQVHFDLLVDDLAQATQQVLAAGGRALGDVMDPGPSEWRIVADPAGHPFCLVTTPE